MSNIQLLQGDCLELIQGLPDGSVDCIITDPPYGTTNCTWDNVVPPNMMFDQLWRVLKPSGPAIIFSQLPFAVDLINACRKYFRYEIIWHKSNKVGFLNAKKMPMRAHENILVFYKKLPTYNPQMLPGKPYLGGYTSSCIYGKNFHPSKGSLTLHSGRYPSDVLFFSKSSSKKFHPTEKPLPLIEWLVKTYTNPGDTVLDCFMGSGTTGVACVRNGRNFIGMELSEQYLEVARNRIDDEVWAVEDGVPF